MLMAFTVYAQTQIKESKFTEHCTIQTTGNANAGKVRIVILYGYGKVVPKDDSGNEIMFMSLVGAKNYMTLQGWEYYGKDGNEMYFKREVTEEQAKQLLPKLRR